MLIIPEESSNGRSTTMYTRLIGFRTVPLLMAGVAEILAVLGVVWVVTPIQAGPLYYRESILAIDGLGVLPILLVPPALVFTGFAALYR